MSRTPIRSVSRCHLVAVLAFLFLASSVVATWKGGGSKNTERFAMRLDKKTGRQLLICTEEQIRKYPQLRQYLPTLLMAGRVKNQMINVKSLKQVLNTLRSLEHVGAVGSIQGDQVETALLQQQNTLLSLKRNYADSLDRLKLALGLPLTLSCEIDDGLIIPITSHLSEAHTISEQTDDLIKKIHLPADTNNAANLRQEIKRLLFSHPAMKGTNARKYFSGEWSKVEKMKMTELQLKDQIKKDRQSLQQLNTQLPRPEGNQKAAQIQAKFTQIMNRIEKLRFQLVIPELEVALRKIEKQPERRPNRNDLQSGRDLYMIRAQLINMTHRAYQEKCQAWSESWPKLPDSFLDGFDVIAENTKAMAIAEKFIRRTPGIGKPAEIQRVLAVSAPRSENCER